MRRSTSSKDDRASPSTRSSPSSATSPGSGGPHRHSTRSWRPSSSPTSSTRRHGRPRSATGHGKRWCSPITRSFAMHSRAGVASRTTPQATASTRRSTVRPARSAARWRCSELVGELGIEIRAGVHTGECEVIDGKCGGADRLDRRSSGEERRTVSRSWCRSTVKDLVADPDLTLVDAGEHELKGVPDRWHLYRRSTGSTEGRRRRGVARRRGRRWHRRPGHGRPGYH